jgi:2-oxo-3-hexenedioate decarboxylase
MTEFDDSMDAPDVNAVADDVLASLSRRRQIATFSSRPAGLTLDQAYQVTSLLRGAFEARGEIVIGRKIGFTNRDLWKVYGVGSPVWGWVTDRTLHALADRKVMAAKDFLEPLIEPEIIFGLKAAPAPGMDEAALLDCIEWVSLGFEIVQSIYPGWEFAAADTVAANGLHGALLVGSRHAIASRRTAWPRELATFQIELRCNGKLSQRGGGDRVLDSPLHAFRHLLELLAGDPRNPPLRGGEIVSTGTLTLAMPVSTGETWTANVSGIPLDEVALRFE